MASRTLSGALALAAGASIALAVSTGTAYASPPSTKDVTAVLFEWSFASVAKECTNTLGPNGYGYVQVSPPATTSRRTPPDMRSLATSANRRSSACATTSLP